MTRSTKRRGRLGFENIADPDGVTAFARMLFLALVPTRAPQVIDTLESLPLNLTPQGSGLEGTVLVR